MPEIWHAFLLSCNFTKLNKLFTSMRFCGTIEMVYIKNKKVCNLDVYRL
jgi:hypothetical protein